MNNASPASRLTSLKRFSPHLLSVFVRRCGSESITLLERAFEIALANGGLNELDFARAPEVSFNPRPARVALILLEIAGVRCPRTIAASVLAATESMFSVETEDDVFVNDLVRQSLLPLGSIPEAVKEAKLIACAIWLDRLRHLHQATNTNIWDGVIAETDQYIALAKEVSTPIEALLAASKKRFLNRLKPHKH